MAHEREAPIEFTCAQVGHRRVEARAPLDATWVRPVEEPSGVRPLGGAAGALSITTTSDLVCRALGGDLLVAVAHEAPRLSMGHPQPIVRGQVGPARHQVARAPTTACSATELELATDDGEPAARTSVGERRDRQVVRHASRVPRGGHHERRAVAKASAAVRRRHAANPRLEYVVLEDEAHV